MFNQSLRRKRDLIGLIFLGLIFLGMICLGLSGSLPAATVRADGACANCGSEFKRMSEQLVSQQSMQVLLEKNRAYLASLAKDDVSKAIKVKSNVLVLMVRLETLKNNIEGSRLFIDKQCKACPRPKQ